MIRLLSLLSFIFASNFACKICKYFFFFFSFFLDEIDTTTLSRRCIILLDICNLKVRNYSSSLSLYIYKRLIPRFRTSITRRDDPSISPSLRYQLEWISCKLRYSRVVRRSWTIYTRQQSIFTRSIDGKNVVKFYRRAIDFDWDC